MVRALDNFDMNSDICVLSMQHISTTNENVSKVNYIKNGDGCCNRFKSQLNL